MNGYAEFDPEAPLPEGTTVLEASAGTGKTHAVATLAVRLLAEGATSLDRLLMVTFGRNATRELRARIRSHLLETVAELEPGEPRERLSAALATFDGARVMTIHEFCAAMYAQLGILASADPSGRVVPDLGPLVREVAHDLYLNRYAFDSRQPPFPLADEKRNGVQIRGAMSLAGDAVSHVLRPIVPTDADGVVAERVGFAQRVRKVAAERRRQLGVLTFDDQLVRLRDTLADEKTGETSCERLRSRFDAVLVDEFQDTDPVQWEILQRLFDGHRRMVLIGDPKQAIYTFRGADIAAYTTAVTTAADRFSLGVNHRSDAALVQGLGELFEGLQLGESIEVHPVTAHRPGCGVRTAGGAISPVVLRTLDQEIRPWQGHERIRADLVAQVRRLLDHEELADGGGWRAVQPGDIAILVRTNRGAARIAAALRAAGVPVALSGSDSIYGSPAADDWLVLLQALASQRRNEVRHALISAFFGLTLGDLASADDGQLADWTAMLRQWDRTLNRAGVAALFASISAETTFIERVLSRPDGERLMTDFRHLAEVLHEASGHTRPSAAWLAEWLQNERTKTVDDERTRRLETDAEAVQVKTVHGAKGLQYPIVLLPDLWTSPGGDDDGRGLLLHEGGRAVLDLGGRDASGRSQRWRRSQTEDAEEALRLLYVAFTRARSQVIAWWARTPHTPRSALQRVLYRDRERLPAAPASGYPLDRTPGSLSPADLPWMRAARAVAVQSVEPGAPASLRADTGSVPMLRALSFDRTIDPDWRRTSYSGLTAGVHAEAPLLADEPEQTESIVPSAFDTAPSPMSDLPGGTQFGTLVHALFEQVDPGPNEDALRARLRAAAAEWLPRFPLPGVTPAELADALVPAFMTPLGPLTDDRSLAQLPVGDRLAELNFDLPMVPSTTFTLGDLAELMRAHLSPDDPLVGYPALLADPALAVQPLKGFLTGSIDAVFRVGAPAGPRFVVVDYKTNRLGGEELTLGHYAQGPMVAAMCASHYPLQALLYCVALHRFLAGRLHGYRPEVHLGGVLYLFVRGMGGPASGPDTGVFAWQPPASLVEELSRRLGGVQK
ncbi:UvrD-helicase domain-containing protein [Micropruina sp.]|uniref:UvrD-helicase domain-containing protein n=1 Tax=Micropruina sp. TaxID=2737536 RepID=UPI002623B2BB|nr:UvrD-helicase domain-containing protein [Micropruina sp.]